VSAPLPLEGITVVDLSRALAGPYCSALLADLGSTIVKVESSKGGDVTRLWPPFEGEHSLYFESTNRNKSSIALDFYSEDGRAVLHRLVAQADVLLENFRPGVMDKLGLDPARLRTERPDLIVASITGFGTTGPLRDAAGLDQVAQGMSGLMSITGPDAEHPYRFGVPIIDMASGIFTALGIAAALAGRASTGQGSLVSTSLLESALALSAFQGQGYLSTGKVPAPQGNDHASLTPYGVFHTADIPLIIAVGNERQWHQFCGILGAPALPEDSRFATGRARTQHRGELKPLLEELLAARPAADWMDEIRAAGIPCGPIYTYEQAFADEQVKAVHMVEHLTRHDGTALPLLRGPLSLDGKPTPVRKLPPALGEDTVAVLTEAGFGPEEIEALLSAGVVHASSPQLLNTGGQA
jgi:crotonobetainyl-CoA:carnitine CoA-transferase CaiB-like acyl-CoA transferase